MKITLAQAARLEFLARVTDKECRHLLYSDGRLFGDLFTVQTAEKIQSDPVLAERLDAFAVLTSALRAGHGFVPILVEAARHCVAETRRLLSA